MDNQIDHIIRRALDDEKFAEKLKKEALSIAENGGQEKEWTNLLKNFANNSEDLVTIVPESEVHITTGERAGTTTATTVTTTTGVGCTFTTTTTTTTDNGSNRRFRVTNEDRINPRVEISLNPVNRGPERG
ncbi:hypothetical protein ABEY96_27450 [Priestia aryabhattai]|uniref:hypothetical protein n=1 Tax=Priestia aryabhattai TaxID=412384 RepID=UPI003D2B0C2F